MNSPSSAGRTPSGNLVSSVTLNGSDVTLKARVEDGHWITYDSQGGSYVAPAFVKGNGTTTAPAVPTRPGYTFHHWSETKDGAAFNFGNALTTALTLYAVWTKNDNTQYTVIHWQENADDDEYSYAEPEVKTGTTGAQTSAAAKSTAAGTKYNGFTAQTIAQQTIAGDGSTIVNVYYKRNEYSVKFYEYKSSGLFGGSWEENTRLRITAKHGANIRAKWPTGTFWYVSQNNQNTAQSNLDTMPIGGKNFYGKASGSGKAYYYVEVLPGESGTETVGGKTYRLDHTDTGYTSGTVTDEERYEMTGFTCNVQYSAKNGDNYSGSKFYYDRNSYNVVYINSGSQAKVTPYLYQQSIADAGNYELTDADAPAGKEGYVFAGWYDAPEGGNEFIFTGKTMPAQNVTVYAHWAEPTVNGKAHIKVDGTDEGTTLTATYGEALNAEELKTLQKAIMKDKTGYTWRGWRTGPNGTGEPFNVDTKIYSDITLYPYYTKDATFTIVYDTVKTDVTVQADGKSYAEDSFADLKSPGKLVAADGEYFLGWSDGAATYQPRDKYQIKSNHADEQNVITLTAQWGARPGDATLIYKSNDGTNREVSETCANNETITTKGENTFTRTGYTLTGWNTASDGSGDAFGLGEEVLLDNSGANVLYAVWTANTDVRYTVHYYKQDTTEKVAADKVVADQTFDDTVIERAVPVTGYTAVAPTEQKLKLDAYDKEISFYYTVNQYGYTIEYYIDGTKDDTRTVEDKADFGTVIDTYPNKCPEGYVFDKHENLPLTIGTDESANVIKVYYKKNVFTLTINYVYEDGSEAAETHTEDVEFDKTYSVTSPNVEGYTPDKAKVEGEMPASNVEVTVTYTKRSDLSYTVYYYWNGTTTPVANSKTVDKQTYNATVTENPATIGGYTAVSDETKTITIGTGENKIIFYYYKNVELTAISSDTVTYDGNEHSVSGFTGAPEEADFTAITVGAKGTNAGTYPAEFAENTVGTVDGTEKYIITAANDGKLVINKAAVTVTITGVNETAVYDGRQHEANGYNYSFNGKPGQITISLKPNVLAIARRTDVGTTYMGLTKDSFTVTSANYDVTIKAVIDGYVTITPVTDKVTVTVTENGDIVTYDGNEHSVKGYKSMTADNTLYDVTKSVKATETAAWTAKGTEAGEYPVGVAAGDFENINKNFTNVAFVIVDGALKINPITDKVTVTITENSATYTYDGTEHSVKGYKSMTADNELYDVTTSVKATETAAWTAKGTNVGEYPVGIVAGDFVNTNTNFTNVEFVVVDGVLKITKATLKVTFTGESDTRVYNGSEQRLTGIEADGLLTGHKYEGLTYLASGTDAGEYTGKFTGTVKITDAAGVDVTENYIVEQEEGKLVINPITEKVTVTVTENSDTVTYDGKEHSVTGYKSMTADNTLYDVKTSVTETETAAWTAKGTNAGAYNVGIVAGDFKNISTNFTNVEFVVVDGKLVINPRPVTFTAQGNSVEYDGQAHGKNPTTPYTVEQTNGDRGLVDGHTESNVNIAFTAISVGTYTKKLEIAKEDIVIKAGETDVTANYAIQVEPGTLTITQNEKVVTITANSHTWEYDGQPHSDGGYTVEYDGKKYTAAAGETVTLPTGDVVEATVVGTVKNVADSANDNNKVTTVIIKNAAGTETNDQYKTITLVPGALKITKRGAGEVKVTLTAADNTVIYDGQAHGAKLNAAGEIEVGTSYTITNLAEGHSVQTVAIDGSETNVGEYPGKLVPNGEVIVDKDGNDVTENYEVTHVNGKLTITARDAVIVEIVGNNATYEYDGEEHEATGYKVERISNSLYTEADFSLAAGVTAQAKGTNVGTYKMGLTDKSFVNTNPNFANVTFVVTDGELEITKRGAGDDKVTLTAADNTVTYDGRAHGAKLNAAGEIEVGTSYTITNLAEGHSVQTVAISGSETNAGVYPGKLVPSGAVIVDKEGNEVTENYEVTYVNGTLTINKYTQKVTVTVIENSATVTYDGTEHSVYGYKSMAANNALYTIKGSVEETPTEAWTAKGTNAGTYNVGIDKGDFKNINENFADVEFVIVDGALKINPITDKVTVTVTEKSATYTYDGTEHSVSGYKSMTADNTLYDVKTSVTETETAAWTAKGTNAGTYDVGIKAGDFKNTNKNFTNVEFVIVDGALKINPITDKVTVTVVENSDTVTYDGKEHSVTGYESMTADNALYTIEGSVEETPTAAWTAKGTNVGEYPVGIVAGDFKNINGNFTNVEFVIVDGVLKITEANIKDYVTLNTVNVTEKYDGKPHATGTATAEDANNNELKIEYSADGETWTEDPSTITATDVADSKTVNVRVSSANYDGYVEGTQELKITKRKVTLTSATDSKPYDGTPLTNSNVTVGGEGFVEGEGASYDVTGTITNVGSVDNTFTYTLNENTNADNYGITKYEGKLTVTGDKIIPEKTTPNVESNYKLGDTILFTITVKNVSTEPVEKITVEDQMAIIVAGTGYTVSADGHTATIDSLASGAQVEISAKHVVTEDDILAGTVGNTATVTWDNTERNVTAKSDDIEDPKSELKVVKETTSEPKNGKTYALDEEIKYTITVTNTGNLTATDIEVTDSLSTNEGKVIGTIASLAPGESETFNFTYTVTEQDILNGKVLNEATAKGKTPDDKTPEGKDEQKDDTDDIDTTLEVIKTSNKQPGEKAKLGEKIEYTITVTNKGNVSYTNVKVDDELTGLHETIAKLGVGESKKFTTEWIVTEDDILNGKVLNVATAKGDDVPDPKDPENPKTPEGKDEKKDDTEGKNSALTVDKKTTSEPKNGKTYALGEEIKYTITVTNTGNLTATDIEVTDSLSTNEGKVIGTIASLAPDESKTFNFTYTVTEQDILNGKVLNVATAKGKTPDPDGKDPEGGGSTEDETDDIDTTLEVVKTSNKQPGEKAKLGEKIEYTITVTNKGNVSYTNVKVDDELTSLHETIAKLGVGDSKKFTTEWTVTEEDILNGKVLNVATAKGDKVPDPKDPENPKTPEGEGKKEDDTEEKQSSFNVEKTLTNLPEKGYFTLGETAEFNITVENTGNLTLTDLTVTEQLSGAKYAESNAYTVNGADAIIAELKPGEQVVIKASYTITEDDLGNKDLKNVVTGKGKGPDGKDPEGGDEEEVPTDDAVSVSGSKTWDDQDNRFEVRPETITLRLHADGAEYKTAEIGADQNWTYKFSKLPKHTKSGAEIVYTVTEDAVVGYETTTVETDSGVNFTNTLRQCTLHIDYTYIRHKGGTPHEAFPPVDMVLYYGQEYSVKSPKLWGFVPNIHKVEGVITEDTVVHVLYSGLDYTLTIEYVYEDGTTAAPTHTEVLKIYDRYGVASPKIPGYVPTWEFVAGSMYAHDEYYRIVYRAIKPQGVGNITLNLGDCFE